MESTKTKKVSKINSRRISDKLVDQKNLKVNDFLLKVKLKKNTNKTFDFFLSRLYVINTQQLSKYFSAKSTISVNLVEFTINVKFKVSNIFMHVSDSLGNQVKFYSIMSLLKLKKNKIKKTEILKTLYEVLLTKHYNLFKDGNLEIIANKDLSFLLRFVEKIRKKLLLINTKFFNSIPYNGCRKEEMTEWLK